MPAPLVLRSSARSEVGPVRRQNLDAVHAGTRLLAVASGLGGHLAGEVASSLVVAALVPLEDGPPSDPVRALRTAALAGNEAIRHRVRDTADLAGMATAVTAVLLAGARLGLAHAGHTRAYLLRGRTFRQLTKDDTAVQLLVDQGRISEEEAHTHPERNRLLRVIDGRELDLSLTLHEALPGDRHLLCSDGLSGTLGDETLADVLRSSPDPRACTDQLVERALRGHAPDNVTCVVADVATA